MNSKKGFEFFKNGKGEWYLDLPTWKGDPADLQMVEGADIWLDLLSDKGNKVKVELSDEIFPDAEILTLIHVKEANLGGGGQYYLENFQGKQIGLKLWLCDVTEFVFGHLPQRIYFTHCD